MTDNVNEELAAFVQSYIPEFIDLEIEVTKIEEQQKYEVYLSTRVDGERYGGGIIFDHPDRMEAGGYADMKAREIEELLKEFVRAGVQELADED